VKVAVMQPYFFPYLGYYSLIQSVDCFVFYSDVQFSRQSWMCRNRILNRQQDSGWEYLHIPVQSAPLKTPFCEIRLAEKVHWKMHIKNQMMLAYGGAPHYGEVMRELEDILKTTTDGLASFNMESLRHLCHWLSIETRMVESRELAYNRSLGREERLLDMVNLLGGSTYINAIGGQALYSKEVWHRKDVDLFFLQWEGTPYSQGDGAFVPNLSILDALMWMGKTETLSRIRSGFALV
jgi:hypothetical protein